MSIGYMFMGWRRRTYFCKVCADSQGLLDKPFIGTLGNWHEIDKKATGVYDCQLCGKKITDRI